MSDIWTLPAPHTGFTWAQLLEAFLADCTPCTRRSYGAAVEQFFTFCPKPPESISAIDTGRWRDHLVSTGRSKATVRARISGLSAWYSFLMRPLGADGNCVVAANPARVKCDKVSAYGRSRKVTPDMFRRILAQATDLQDRAWLTCYALTARRRREIANLTWDAIERTGSRWFYRYVGKGEKERRRQLPPPAVTAILAWTTPADTGPLWTIGSSTMAKHLKRYARKAGIDPKFVRLHGLRHLAAQLRREDGATLEEVQALLDHSSLATTQIYLAAMKDETDERADSVWDKLVG